MEELTSAKIVSAGGQSIELVLKGGALYLNAPVGLISVLAVRDTYMENGELKSLITFSKENIRKSVVAHGEVGLARALFLCSMKRGRNLVTDNDYLKLINDKKCGKSFEVLVNKTKDSEKRIECAYRYE